MENMSVEVAMMFIRNCPNSDLSSVFKCKPISKWSAMEVQEAIDEHQNIRQGGGPLERRDSWWQQQLQLLAAQRQRS